MKIVLAFLVMLLISSSLTYAKNTHSPTPKEVIESIDGFAVWKEFKDYDKRTMLSGSFIEATLANLPTHLEKGSKVYFNATKMYLPNNYYVNLDNCQIKGKIRKVLHGYYDVRPTELICNKNTYIFPNGFIVGKQNMSNGLSKEDFTANYENNILSIMIYKNHL